MSSKLDQAQQYCLELTKKSNSSFYHSFIFLDKNQQQAMVALYAFCRLIDDVVDEGDCQQTAQQELDAWRERIAAMYRGSAEHPVCIALAHSLGFYPLKQQHFLELISGMEMDLIHHSYPSFAQLEQYCYKVASVVGLLATEIFGYKNQQTLDYAYDLGLALQLTNILRDVKEDALRGRVYLPLDEMEKFQLQAADLQKPANNRQLYDLFAMQGARAEAYYHSAYAKLPPEDRYAQLPGLIMAAIYHKTLHNIKKQGYQVLKGKTSISTLNKIFTAWQVARLEKKRERNRLRSNR